MYLNCLLRFAPFEEANASGFECVIILQGTTVTKRGFGTEKHHTKEHSGTLLRVTTNGALLDYSDPAHKHRYETVMANLRCRKYHCNEELSKP